MKKSYIAPEATLVMALSQQLLAAVSGEGRKLTTVEAAQGWKEWEIKEAEANTTFNHGQSSSGTGSRAKYDVWSEWDD